MKPPWIILFLSFAILTSANESSSLNQNSEKSKFEVSKPAEASENSEDTSKTTHGESKNSDKIIPKNKVPKEMCEFVKNRFSSAVANYSECITKFARPIEVCLRCRDKYLIVQKTFEYMEDFKQDNVSCKVVLTKQDRLGILEHEYNYVNGPDSVWEQASCKNCYTKNDPTELKANHTTNFEELWDKTIVCFRQFVHINWNDDDQPLLTRKHDHNINGSLCQNCSEIYDKMRKYFWNHVVPSTASGTIGGVCYDIRDRFNVTGIIWKEEFDCEPRPDPIFHVYPAILVAVLAIVLTYTCEPCIIPYFWPKKATQRVDEVQPDVYDGDFMEIDDENGEAGEFMDGNWEVHPGITANEYLAKLVKVDFKTDDGSVYSSINVPPEPSQAYDMEFDNDDWTGVSKKVLLQIQAIANRFKNGEISQRERDLLMIRLILVDLNERRHRHSSQAMQASVNLDSDEGVAEGIEGVPMQISPNRSPERSLNGENSDDNQS